MSKTKNYVEFATAKMQFDFELSDSCCEDLDAVLSDSVAEKFGDDIFVKAFIDDHLLFVECTMFSFKYAKKSADKTTKFIRGEVRRWIEDTAKAATAELFASISSTNTSVV
jgi:hypothetical protein